MNDIIYAGKHSLTLSVGHHEHSSWEFIYCTAGNGTFIFDEYGEMEYSAGDVVVIPPATPHSNVSEQGFTNIHVNLINSTMNFREPILYHDDANQYILSALSAIFSHFYGASEYRTSLLSAYANLMVTCTIAYHQGHSHSPLVEEIENNIIQNYPDCNYELDRYLQSFPFSYDYLRKIFKKEIGITPHQYLNEKRLQAAVERLTAMQSDNPSITEISLFCGFRDPLYFSRMFKKRYGVAPSYYLTKHHEDTEIPSVQDPDRYKIML